MLPSPSAIALTARDWAPELAFNSYVTLRETLIGFLAALVLSVPLAVALAFTTIVRRSPAGGSGRIGIGSVIGNFAASKYPANRESRLHGPCQAIISRLGR